MWATSGDIDLHFELHGEGEPVLFIHGFPLSGELWEGVVARLSAECRAIVPDLRGHGASGVSDDASMASYADDLAAILNAIEEARPVVLVGMSMGGYIALEFIRRHPGRVRALVLVGSRAKADAPDVARTRRETAELVLREGSGVVADGMADRLFAPGAPLELRERWRRIMAATPPKGIAAALRAMAERQDSQETLKRIARPVLVVVGADDAITPANEARAMAEAAPGAKLKVIPAAGHMTPVERPEEIAAALRDFLRHNQPNPR